MATKTISQQKVADLSHLMVKHLSEKSNQLREQVKVKIEQFLRKDYSKEVLDFFTKYPNLVVKCEGISLYYAFDNQRDYRFTVYPNLPKYPDKDSDLVKMFKLGEGADLIDDLMKQYCANEKKKNELRNKIKCTLNTLKSYARIKNEFPEAYKLLVEKIDEEVLNTDDPCTDIESLRAELTAK